jgi:hypothetical protein
MWYFFCFNEILQCTLVSDFCFFLLPLPFLIVLSLSLIFYVHGSVHLGNICSIKGPTTCTYYVLLCNIERNKEYIISTPSWTFNWTSKPYLSADRKTSEDTSCGLSELFLSLHTKYEYSISHSCNHSTEHNCQHTDRSIQYSSTVFSISCISLLLWRSDCWQLSVV